MHRAAGMSALAMRRLLDAHAGDWWQPDREARPGTGATRTIERDPDRRPYVGDIDGQWFAICPPCGRAFPRRTERQLDRSVRTHDLICFVNLQGKVHEQDDDDDELEDQ